ncbi:MAG: pyridine nucleotide-disulfide oxidoreductase [Nitrospirales bacterium]|nr:MAG: pyridine nucleotide-disulfide oxidoreductase [Nitrospirales bacterium]
MIHSTKEKTNFFADISRMRHYQVVIVGGGAAGVSVAARLCRILEFGSVAVVEPSTVHHYQPLWTLVGGGIYPREFSERREASVIPEKAEWLHETVAGIDPKKNEVFVQSGLRLRYDYLVVCPGMQLDWEKIEGLKGNIGKFGICSNYSYETVQHTWPTIEGFKSGKALFTHPKTPIKCGGAPQKIMYLAESTFRDRAIRQKAEIHFVSGMADSFTAPHYAKVLDQVMRDRGITAHYHRNLMAIRPEERIAVFERLDRPGEYEEFDYTLLHVTPPMSAPDFIKQSRLANDAGWVDVDKHTLQHSTYPNVFSLGDASSLPTSKTAAAIRRQAPVLVENLLSVIKRKEPHVHYDGYTSCPIVTDYGKLILAEFAYDKNPCETFPFDQSKERLSMYLLKKHVLPPLYWHGMLKGRV